MILAIAMADEEDVSVCARYRKYKYWNPVLESEFLQNLVSDFPNSIGISDQDYFGFEETEEQKPQPLITTSTWTLSLLEDELQRRCGDDNEVDVKSDNFLHQLAKRKKKVKVKKNSLLRNERSRYLERKETISSELDEHHWSDLFLVQTVITDQKEEKTPELRTANAHSDEDEDIVYDLDIVEKLVVNERKRFGGDLAEYNRNPVRSEIRNKVVKSQDKGKVKFESLESLRKYWCPPVFIKSAKVN